MSEEANTMQPVPTVAKKVPVWSIGIYTGETPFDLKPAQEIENPVICAQDVSDIQADFVADPFMIKAGEIWHMFFEVMNASTKKGEIGLATSEDGLAWDYRQIVLREPFHLSYPCVVYRDGEYYMTPETHEANSIRLYRADRFPDKWSLAGRIMDGAWADPSVFFFDGLCWMFTSRDSRENDTLDLFHAEAMGGPWEGHPMNPVVEGDSRIARPGGRVVVNGNKVVRFTQDCSLDYGERVRALEVSELTRFTYREREIDQSPVLSAGGQAWHQSGMHHVDPHRVNGRWLACVDGRRFDILK
ncbi:MAG TPA: hypothetical protein VNI02_24570 [Blastocatellia bacterium]|jgi:hypothetical protein|nr:hypothetical protein [Blastocatellia bacterium]